MFIAKCSLIPRNEIYSFISPDRFKGRLKDKVAFSTGAGRGLGRASALAFASAGASVACVARRQNDLDEIVSEIKQRYGTPGLAAPADVADPAAAAAKKVVAEVEKHLGPVGILVNAAGMTRYSPFEAETSIDAWWRVLEVNVRGCVALMQAVLPSMKARRTGTIISVSSTSGSLDISFNTAYATSKAAMIKFHQDLDVEIRDRGIRSYAGHPGSVPTDLSKADGAVNMEAMGKNPRMQEVMEKFQEMEYQTPELSANTFVALGADEDARFLSGMHVDSQFDLGGMIEEAKKGEGSRIVKEKLYHLKLDES
jgi:NAD(P)-dependent dehydrogenase (short-subunit alcohol dehydrogenase family)